MNDVGITVPRVKATIPFILWSHWIVLIIHIYYHIYDYVYFTNLISKHKNKILVITRKLSNLSSSQKKTHHHQTLSTHVFFQFIMNIFFTMRNTFSPCGEDIEKVHRSPELVCLQWKIMLRFLSILYLCSYCF